MLDNKFWNTYFQDYDVLNMVVPYNDLLDLICNELDIKKDEKILDVGSGTGNLSIKMSKLGADVKGIELSPYGILQHIRKAPNASVIEGDITKRFPFLENNFDKIVSNNTLYTISAKDRDIIIKEMFRVLKPGGKIVISNISTNFSPITIYVSHIKMSIKRYGFIRTLINIFKLAPATLRMFKYNTMIKEENSSGTYDFFKKEEQKELLNIGNFNNISETKIVYAGQGILNSAIK